jgi:hypothetical protein
MEKKKKKEKEKHWKENKGGIERKIRKDLTSGVFCFQFFDVAKVMTIQKKIIFFYFQNLAKIRQK